MTIRVRPAVLTAGFGILLAVIANLAWATAMGTTGPWFTAPVNLTVYAIAAVLASVLGVVLVLHAAACVARLDASVTRLERRIALLRSAPTARRGGGSLPTVVESGLESGEPVGTGPTALVRIEREGHDALVPLSRQERGRAGAARRELLRQLLRERGAIVEARSGVWASVAGPTLACVVFLAAAAPMLPGSDGFAASQYVLNTTLVLFLSYGLTPLVAWALLTLATLGSPTRRLSR